MKITIIIVQLILHLTKILCYDSKEHNLILVSACDSIKSFGVSCDCDWAIDTVNLAGEQISVSKIKNGESSDLCKAIISSQKQDDDLKSQLITQEAHYMTNDESTIYEVMGKINKLILSKFGTSDELSILHTVADSFSPSHTIRDKNMIYVIQNYLDQDWKKHTSNHDFNKTHDLAINAVADFWRSIKLKSKLMLQQAILSWFRPGFIKKCDVTKNLSGGYTINNMKDLANSGIYCTNFKDGCEMINICQITKSALGKYVRYIRQCLGDYCIKDTNPLHKLIPKVNNMRNSFEI